MKVVVHYFAAVRELAGVSEEELDCESGAKLGDLAGQLEARHPRLAGRLGQVRFAVNEEFAPLGTVLEAGDVVAVIPPVAGGSGPPPVESRVGLRTEPLVLAEVIELVRHPAAGAIATFIGVVRDHSDGREVSALEYSAYDAMALKEMAKIVRELEAEVPGVRLAVFHRIGRLEIGDDAVHCAASSAHRGEAFTAGRELIDRIKDRVPIWKREKGPDGEAWVGWQGEPGEPSEA